MSGEAHDVIVDALPSTLFFSEDETPTPAKVRGMLDAMKDAGYSVRGMAIESELSGLGVWFAEQYVDLATQAQHHATQWADLVARERRIQHITMDAAYAAAIDRLGEVSPEVQRVTMEALGCVALLREPLRELSRNIQALRTGRWEGDATTALPPSLTRCLRILADAGDVLEAEVLKAAEATP